jgi:hypothetical protein
VVFRNFIYAHHLNGGRDSFILLNSQSSAMPSFVIMLLGEQISKRLVKDFLKFVKIKTLIILLEARNRMRVKKKVRTQYSLRETK